MGGDSISIEAVRIGPVATAMAERAKMMAALWFLLLVSIVFSTIGIATDGRGENPAPAQVVVGLLFWGTILGLVGLRHLKVARRATAAAARAKADASSRWLLSRRMIIGLDTSGSQDPDVMFKITIKQRAMLLAVPTATVVARS